MQRVDWRAQRAYVRQAHDAMLNRGCPGPRGSHSSQPEKEASVSPEDPKIEHASATQRRVLAREKQNIETVRHKKALTMRERTKTRQAARATWKEKTPTHTDFSIGIGTELRACEVFLFSPFLRLTVIDARILGDAQGGPGEKRMS